MLDVRYSGKFRKDFKVCSKRGYKMILLQQMISTLLIPAPLPVKNREHALNGNYSIWRECHIEPDWLLLYRQKEDELFLISDGYACGFVWDVRGD